MNGMTYLTVALALVWGGVALYVARLAVLRSGLESRVERLEKVSRPLEKQP